MGENKPIWSEEEKCVDKTTFAIIAFSYMFFFLIFLSLYLFVRINYHVGFGGILEILPASVILFLFLIFFVFLFIWFDLNRTNLQVNQDGIHYHGIYFDKKEIKEIILGPSQNIDPKYKIYSIFMDVSIFFCKITFLPQTCRPAHIGKMIAARLITSKREYTSFIKDPEGFIRAAEKIGIKVKKKY